MPSLQMTGAKNNCTLSPVTPLFHTTRDFVYTCKKSVTLEIITHSGHVPTMHLNLVHQVCLLLQRQRIDKSAKIIQVDKCCRQFDSTAKLLG
jgi:hypothetical protein